MALDEVEERLGQVSIAPAALMAEEPQLPNNLIFEMTAAERVQRDPREPQLVEGRPAIQEFRLRAPDSIRPLHSGRSSVTWVGGILIILLPVILMFVVMKLVPSSFSDWQAGDRTFELASSSSRGMKDLATPRSELAPRLVAHGSRGMSGEPVPLRLTVRGRADGGVVMIAGLIPGMTLSSGRAVGTDAWEVPAKDVANTWIGPPQNFVGVVKLIAELHLSDATIAHRASIGIEWIAAAPAGAEQVSSPADPEQVPLATGSAGPEQVSVAAKPPETVSAPQQRDQDEIAPRGNKKAEQHGERTRQKRVASNATVLMPRKPTKASTRRRAPNKFIYALPTLQTRASWSGW